MQIATPDEEPQRPAELQDVAPEILDAAPLGDVQMYPDDRPPPAGWQVTDGATCSTSDYPAFAQQLGIPGAEFELPVQRAMPGYVFIIKLRS